jgi:acyl dehydratase
MIGGPFFEDLEVGMIEAAAPAVTLTDGLAAVHQAIVGGLAVLRIRTVDQEDRPVLDFWRCAMLPLRNPEGRTGGESDFSGIPEQLDRTMLLSATAGWRLDLLPPVAAERASDLRPGMRWTIERGDVVCAAPELARLTLNIAAPHHDQYTQETGERLVYGGHAIGLAAAQTTRLLPNIVTIVGWHACDHLAPVREGDTLRSALEVERIEPGLDGHSLVDLRQYVRAHRDLAVPASGSRR